MQKKRALKLKKRLHITLLKKALFGENVTLTLTCYHFNIYILFDLLLTRRYNIKQG